MDKPVIDMPDIKPITDEEVATIKSKIERGTEEARSDDLIKGLYRYILRIEADSKAMSALQETVERLEKPWQPIAEFSNDHYDKRMLFLVPPYGATTGHLCSYTDKWELHSVLNKEAVPTHFSHILSPPSQSGEQS
ncbi:MAG: hypothetical protein COB78_09865 [Hyphomicrobiales bacterium]|nr:MAG: hypothetical protein COB78_09865 [Hyphomicrobiales bacterium]